MADIVAALIELLNRICRGHNNGGRAPFTREIMSEEFSRHLKLLDIKYEGTTNPNEHMESYRSWTKLNGALCAKPFL